MLYYLLISLGILLGFYYFAIVGRLSCDVYFRDKKKFLLDLIPFRATVVFFAEKVKEMEHQK